MRHTRLSVLYTGINNYHIVSSVFDRIASDSYAVRNNIIDQYRDSYNTLYGITNS